VSGGRVLLGGRPEWEERAHRRPSGLGEGGAPEAIKNRYIRTSVTDSDYQKSRKPRIRMTAMSKSHKKLFFFINKIKTFSGRVKRKNVGTKEISKKYNSII
jgi:hypothetical protein